MTILLKTKLYIPPVRPELVSRPRLIERLNAGPHRKLTLVSAPAGYGKTTLISEWICGREPRVRVAWISLDEGDNDPVRFLNYLIAALQQVDDNIGQTVQQVLQSPQLPPLQNLVTSLINDISAAATVPLIHSGQRLTLVLDDYHLITATLVHQVLQLLLEHQPPSMHVVISTREDPPLPLPQLRARGQVTEVRERDLRFTAEEAAAFLDRTMGLHLSTELVTALETRTEGWIAGLQLAALALQEHPDTARARAFIAAFAGDDRYIVDYLGAEVLQRQPEAARDFLRQTAILDQLTAPLCDAVTESQDSQALLDQLEGANLFLIPLDRRREWYRYHRLFAEFLRTQLDQKEQKLLHQRAMRWHEAHGFTSQAIKHALAYASASGDPLAGSGQALDEAERLILRAAEDMLHSGNLLTVRAWLDALPDERVRASGELATYKGWALTLTGDTALAEDYAAAAELYLCQVIPADKGDAHSRTGETPTTLQGKLLLLRSWIALLDHQEPEHASELAAGALQALGADQLHWRIIALWVMAESLERTRNISEAIDAFRQVRQAGLALGSHIFVATVEMSLALSLNNHGQRQEAIAACEEAIRRYTDDAGRVSPVAGLVFSRLGMLYYEANQLDLARSCRDRILAFSQQPVMGDELDFLHGLSAPILYAQGETGAALEALRKSYQFATRTGYADADWFLGIEVNIRLKQGDLPFAFRWAENAGLSPDDAPQYLRIEQQLVYARLLLAQDRLPDAQRWLDRLARFAGERGLKRWLITVHVLQALTAERLRDRPAALDFLAQALQIAAPGDYYRAFLDEDARVIALLPAVRRVAPAFVDQLLEFAGVAGPKPDATAQPLIEALSERELEVLGLIAAGLSNREIAQKLYIAVGTVKRHINHIYGKLEVHSRTQAVAKARELRLLERDA